MFAACCATTVDSCARVIVGSPAPRPDAYLSRALPRKAPSVYRPRLPGTHFSPGIISDRLIAFAVPTGQALAGEAQRFPEHSLIHH